MGVGDTRRAARAPAKYLVYANICERKGERKHEDIVERSFALAGEQFVAE